MANNPIKFTIIILFFLVSINVKEAQSIGV
jgi:hypothetical protein